jgi:antitoxin ParD1/3/4
MKREHTIMRTHNAKRAASYDRPVVDLMTFSCTKNTTEFMPTELSPPEQQNREDEDKLALLRSLAAEGFNELNQGRGTIIDAETQLRDFIAQIGRRCAEGRHP